MLLAALLWVLSTNFFASLLLLPLESPFTQNKEQHYDYYIVLAGGVNDKSPVFYLGDGAFKRAVYGLIHAKKDNVPLVYSGAGPENLTESEGFVSDMRKIADGFGTNITVEPNLTQQGFYVVLEDKSMDTYENAKFTAAIFKDVDLKNSKIALITSAYHMHRSLMLFRHFGFDPEPMACDFKAVGLKMHFKDFMPNMGAFYNTFIALKEYMGILSLYIRL